MSLKKGSEVSLWKHSGFPSTTIAVKYKYNDGFYSIYLFFKKAKDESYLGLVFYFF